ncbi:MAG: LamG domain-containing protein [Armatimonadota bacterium]
MKQRLIMLTFGIALLCGIPTANAKEASLVGLWHFDEGLGSVAYDSSGNKNNGYIKGNAVWVEGISGKALRYDGTDAYVEIPHSQSLNTPMAITVCAWIKIDQKSSFGKGLTIADKTRGTKLNKSWHLYWDDRFILDCMQTLSFALGSSDGKGISIASSESAVEDSDWHFVVGTMDSNASEYQQKLYVDGKLVGRKNNKNGVSAITGNTFPLLIGIARPDIAAMDGGTWFNGRIDEVSIYNRALAQDEILALYKSNGEAKQ